jgi:hypothetical protein
MIYSCCDALRRNAVRDSKVLNGIDFLEVDDNPAQPNDQRQRKLFVHFLNPLDCHALTKDNVRLEGGERIRNVVVTDATVGAGEQANVLTVEVDKPGDFSIYTLRLVQDGDHPQSPDGFDPVLSSVAFSFKAGCPGEFDCKAKAICPIETVPEPEINYLAKDYASFRRLMLDRMALLMPRWKDRNPADLGIALVEVLAYLGDYLSYQQDAVATEAYMGTARRRVSARRHARLVDYFMHDGCNARAWVQVQVDADNVHLEQSVAFLTRGFGQGVRLTPNSTAYEQALGRKPKVFKTMHPATLYRAHNELPFYTWEDKRCCLPTGATGATLKGHYPNLKKGDVLVFEEVLGPRTGRREDADLTRRHPVRLREVVHTDGNGNPLVDPLDDQPITEIAWDLDDKLPFPFCLSAGTDPGHAQECVEDVSVARGNIVLVDHGLTVEREDLGVVPQPKLYRVPSSEDHCLEQERVPVIPRHRPTLQEKPLTHAGPYDPTGSAYRAMHWGIRNALPAIVLESELNGKAATWRPKRDLLRSGPDKEEFVVEIEGEGATFLRFGDDRHGRRPEPQTAFFATYRVGNGIEGNVGAEAIKHIVTHESAVIAVRNPLPAQGGVDPETIEEVRQRAPYAFRTQERAVTEGDYAEVTERDSEVQRATATFRWTGSWHTVFLTVDPFGGLPVDEAFVRKVRRRVERYRMAGYDLEVDGPRFVPLEVEMHVCAKPDYFRSDVKAALLEVFSNRLLPDGGRGVFHPDHFTFGQPVYLSRLYTAAQRVSGVASVHITKCQRQGIPDLTPLREGTLKVGRLEIARLDNDPNYPEHGVLRLTVGGGK